VHIRGDRTASYEHVLKVMAAVQRAGILKLGFVTEPES
jgi:biopolymer transport protein ExbD